MAAIDIHHHYVPQSIIAEAKRHGSALGIEVTEDKDGTFRFSFNGGPRYPLVQGLTDVEPRRAMMEKSKIALAARPKAPSCASAPSAYFKNLYVDTLVCDVETLDFLRRKVGAEHLLLGSDFPYILGDWQCVDKVEALPCSVNEKQMILEGNASKLLKIAAS